MIVYLLWLHDCVIGVYGNKRKALYAAAKFRRLPEYRGCEWRKSKRAPRWWTQPSLRLNGSPHISRLEIEEERVR